ncbi:hypothetical protein CGC21_8645 [Leishmania donovani]|uniref:Uncharacterized protein n=1 Tax=Leishmania donovani TaxID=5661 RepID=A0A504WVS0_LEIDO|nr:hypothetical protein CGC21_8645 [Leishmania donovani]
MLLRNRLQVSEEYVRHLEDPAHSICLEAALSKSYSNLVQIVRTSAYTADTYTMQTLVVVPSTIYGVVFNGRDMKSPENRNTALVLKRAFDSLLTPAQLSRVLTLCSANSRYERAMGPVSPDARPRAGA